MAGKKSKYEIKLPTFIIAGAAKSGTTSLSRYLGEHPQIYLPEPELNYFAFAEKTPDYTVVHSKLLDSFEKYQSFYRFPLGKIPKITGEKSVSYLYHPWVKHVIHNIKNLHPGSENLKIIIILRHPVDRMYSQYLFNTRNNEELPFEVALKAWENREAQNWVPAYDYIGASYYADAVEAYINHFRQVKVFLFEDLKLRPKELLEEIYQFLEVDPDFVPETIGEAFNFSGLPNNSILGRIYSQDWLRKLIGPLKNSLPHKTIEKIALSFKSKAVDKPKLNNELRKELTKHFKDDIKKLEKTIKRDLSHWLK